MLDIAEKIYSGIGQMQLIILKLFLILLVYTICYVIDEFRFNHMNAFLEKQNKHLIVAYVCIEAI